MCCANGKVMLPGFKEAPEPLSDLSYKINESSGKELQKQSKNFLKNARKYNGCFQRTSFGSKEVREENFMPTFKIQGQIYHRIGSLLPLEDQPPVFLQIYFVGNDEEEVNIRCNHSTGVDKRLVYQIQKALHEHNSYIKEFKAAIERKSTGENFQIVINPDKRPAGEYRGRFNAPTADEVALVIVGQSFEKRDIIIQSKDNKFVRIPETHRSYDALQYLLIIIII
ncbi:uncharacterized protein LOC111632139 [Centruroides sculpturatus]|uniref:uncharacterized protein LOC111617592 n=1 Tax=Centruroides sculpturatus TaxID=218467 RepID=UPI000C6E648E|nr:uncharacterized protein LOC111617592 [Centruroides sculpturatus]XP_023232281.1 uncharacterized protein LOC111632139 [Centruroides sculpturatus]